MDTKNLQKQIIDQLIRNTKDGSVVWNLTQSIFNSETSHRYHSLSIDRKTKFDIEISLDRDMNVGYCGGLNVENHGLVNGHINISDGVKELHHIIYDKYIKPKLVIKDEKTILSLIVDNMGDKESVRDNKIDKILNIFKW